MYLEYEAEDIQVMVRCAKCDSVMHISDQYEYSQHITVDVMPCGCEESELADDHDVNRHLKRD